MSDVTPVLADMVTGIGPPNEPSTLTHPFAFVALAQGTTPARWLAFVGSAIVVPCARAQVGTSRRPATSTGRIRDRAIVRIASPLARAEGGFGHEHQLGHARLVLALDPRLAAREQLPLDAAP